jgi:hypothetical protein
MADHQRTERPAAALANALAAHVVTMTLLAA